MRTSQDIVETYRNMRMPPGWKLHIEESHNRWHCRDEYVLMHVFVSATLPDASLEGTASVVEQSCAVENSDLIEMSMEPGPKGRQWNDRMVWNLIRGAMDHEAREWCVFPSGHYLIPPHGDPKHSTIGRKEDGPAPASEAQAQA